jgi:hypothetical protein
MPLSTSALLYLGADGVAPPDKKFGMGQAVPCREVTVDLKTLSGVLPAAAFWSLRASSAVTIGMEAKKGLLGTKQRVAVRRTGGAPQNPLDAAILAAIDDGKPYAKETVARWLGRDYANPWSVVMAFVERELIDAGLLRSVEAQGMLGKLGQMASGRTRVEGDCAAIAGIRGDVDGAIGRWQSLFHGANAPLAQAVLKECRDGVDSRLENDD